VRQLLPIGALFLGACIFPLPDARAPGVPVPITSAQKNADFTSTSTTLVVSLPGPSTAGNALVVGTVWKPASAAPPVLTDSQNDSFRVLVPGTVGNDTAGTSELSFASLSAPGSAPISLTLTASGATYLELACIEYAGIDSSAPLDVFQQVLNTSGSQTPTAQLVTTASGDLLVAWVVSLRRVDPGTGFQPRATVNGDLVEDLEAPTAGSYTVTAIGNDPNWLVVAAGLRAQRR
jgi:hypothetical protein